MGIVERKEREKNIKKFAILEASVKLFNEKGFLNITIQDIAKYAEVSPGSIYLHYKSKDDIYAAIADLGTQKVDKLLSEFLTLHEPLNKDKIKGFVRGFIDIYSEFGVYFDVLILSYKGKKTLPELSEEIVVNLRDGALKSLFKTVEYFEKITGEKRGDVLKSKILLIWGMLLGTSQLLDVVGRKKLLSENDVELVLSQSVDAIEKLLFNNESHS